MMDRFIHLLAIRRRGSVLPPDIQREIDAVNRRVRKLQRKLKTYEAKAKRHAQIDQAREHGKYLVGRPRENAPPAAPANGRLAIGVPLDRPFFRCDAARNNTARTSPLNPLDLGMNPVRVGAVELLKTASISHAPSRNHHRRHRKALLRRRRRLAWPSARVSYDDKGRLRRLPLLRAAFRAVGCRQGARGRSPGLNRRSR
jgi:hypothetical protein